MDDSADALDLANGAGLVRAVRARVPAGADIWLDVGSVSFIDIGTLTALYQTAAGLPDVSRIRLNHASAHLRHLIEISGLADPHPRQAADGSAGRDGRGVMRRVTGFGCVLCGRRS